MNNSQNYKSPSVNVFVKSIHRRAMLKTEPSWTGYRAHSQNALRAYSLLRKMVSPLFTGHPFTKPHVPCVAANRKRNRLPRPFAKPRFALTRCFAAVLLIDWALPSWTQIEKSSCKHEIFLSMPTSNLLHKKIPWLSPGY